MTTRLAIAVAALTGALVASAAACGRSPHRVASSDGRCSVMMRGPAAAHEGTIEVGGVLFRQLARGAEPHWSQAAVDPLDHATYVLRRVIAPEGAALRGQPLLDAAAQGFARVLDTSFPDRFVRTVNTHIGPAIEVRTKPAPKPLPRSVIVAARFHALPDGFCEVSLFGPHAEEEVADYFASVQLSPSDLAR